MDRINNIKFLTEASIQKIIGFIVVDNNVEYDEAFHAFYLSETFQKLNDPSTGLYRESAAYVYEIYKSEIQHGKIN